MAGKLLAADRSQEICDLTFIFLRIGIPGTNMRGAFDLDQACGSRHRSHQSPGSLDWDGQIGGPVKGERRNRV
jgi:hypothetical protein